MSTLSKEDLSIAQDQQVEERDRPTMDRSVLGTIAVGLGSLEERLEIEAVDAFRSKKAGPQIPAAFIRKEKRSTGSLLRDFWHDETSLPLVGSEPGSRKEAREWRLAILSAAALAALILLFLSERGLLDPWIQKFFG